MVVAGVGIVVMVGDYAVACIELRLQLQPSQFCNYSIVVPYILTVLSAVTFFYITSARSKEDCGVRDFQRLRVHDRRTDLYSCHTSSLGH